VNFPGIIDGNCFSQLPVSLKFPVFVVLSCLLWQWHSFPLRLLEHYISFEVFGLRWTLNTLLPNVNFDFITASSSDQKNFRFHDTVFFHSLLVLSVSQVVEDDAITIRSKDITVISVGSNSFQKQVNDLHVFSEASQLFGLRFNQNNVYLQNRWRCLCLLETNRD